MRSMFHQLWALLFGMAVTLMPLSAFAGDFKKIADVPKRPMKVLLFMDTNLSGLSGRSLQMKSEEAIRRVFNATGKVILDLDPTKAGTEGFVETKNQDSRFVRVFWWFFDRKRTSVSV